MTRTARVSRELYLSALADAIEWQVTFCDSHTECRGDRCEAWRDSQALLRRYRAARDRLLRRAESPS